VKALSIRQPWAFAICHLGKRIENRDWRYPPSYRGPLLIHASSWWSRKGVAADWRAARTAAGKAWLEKVGYVSMEMLQASTGCIVARARLVDVVTTDRGGHRHRFGEPCELCGEPAELPEDLGRQTGACKLADPWAVPESFGFILADVVPLAKPLPFKGALGFFDVPDALLAGAA